MSRNSGAGVAMTVHHFIWVAACCVLGCSTPRLEFADGTSNESSSGTGGAVGVHTGPGGDGLVGGETGGEGAEDVDPDAYLDDIYEDILKRIRRRELDSVEDLQGDDWNAWQRRERKERERFERDGNRRTSAEELAKCKAPRGAIELCGNAVDDDCDGDIDEFRGKGDFCYRGCDPGRYGQIMCNGATGLPICNCWNRARCGDGTLGHMEECDGGHNGSGGSLGRDEWPLLYDQWGALTEGVELFDRYCTQDCAVDIYMKKCGFQRTNPDGTVAIEYPDTMGGPVVGSPEPTCPGNAPCSRRTQVCTPRVGSNHFTRCPRWQAPDSITLDKDEDIVQTERWYSIVEATDSTRECWINCTEAEDCPGGLERCYQGICVAF